MLTIGIIFIGAGILWLLLFHKREDKIVKDYTNRLLTDYDEEDEKATEEAENAINECTKMVWKNEVIFRGIPAGLILTGALVLLSVLVR